MGSEQVQVDSGMSLPSTWLDQTEITQISEYICAPMGECKPCPENNLAYPYCRPYNNRQEVQCTHTGTNAQVQGWSACGKFVHAEVFKYSQFVLLNVLIVVFALTIYIWR